jgi:branched-chain amino acid aminotransferase
VYTPPLAASILPGITRDSVLRIAADLGYEVREQAVPREMLYIADEVFFAGTAVEITPVRSIDKITIGSGRRGPVTEAIQGRFFAIIEGRAADTHGWLTYVHPQRVPAAAVEASGKVK